MTTTPPKTGNQRWAFSKRVVSMAGSAEGCRTVLPHRQRYRFAAGLQHYRRESPGPCGPGLSFGISRSLLLHLVLGVDHVVAAGLLLAAAGAGPRLTAGLPAGLAA